MQNILFLIKKYWKELTLFILIILVGGIASYSLYLETKEPKIEANVNLVQEEEKVVEEKMIFVDIKGAVKKPGVYQVSDKSIVNDAIEMAGGFNKDAYKNGINLSKKLTDEMVIYVYKTSEIKNSKTEEKVTESCPAPTYEICDCTDNKISIIETPENFNNSVNNTANNSVIDENSNESVNNDNVKEENNTSNSVNINTASITELTSISGIGEAKAKAIIEYRTQNGEFTNITDLLNVSGIGEALFAKIKDFITI